MSQSILRMLCSGALGFGLSLSFVTGQVPEAELDSAEGTLIVAQQVAMPVMGPDRLGSILNRYYKEGLGGPSHWDNVVSLRVSGRLTLEGGAFKFDAYQKKPHYIKMAINGNQTRMRMGYDGTTAWQVAKRGAAAVEMDAESAREFIQGAQFGNHLLYPYALGKHIEYLDTVPVDGEICHQVRVALDTGYQVDYFIDIHTYLEVQVITTDLRSGKVTTVVFEDYIRECGMSIARKIVSSEDGAWASTLQLDEVKVNSGVMPWMFKMPK